MTVSVGWLLLCVGCVCVCFSVDPERSVGETTKTMRLFPFLPLALSVFTYAACRLVLAASTKTYMHCLGYCSVRAPPAYSSSPLHTHTQPHTTTTPNRQNTSKKKLINSFTHIHTHTHHRIHTHTHSHTHTHTQHSREL